MVVAWVWWKINDPIRGAPRILGVFREFLVGSVGYIYGIHPINIGEFDKALVLGRGGVVDPIEHAP